MDYHVRYFQSADGATIAAARGGTGTPVLLSPAFGTSIETDWATYSEAFGDHDLITWDRRGWGLSERGSPCLDPESYLLDAEAVADGFGLDSFAVVGTLMGTIEATSLASRNSERVTRLVLRSPVTGLADWASIPGVSAARVEVPRSDGRFGLCGVGGLVVEWAEVVVVAVAALGVVPAFDPFEDRGCELVAGVPVVLVEEFALQDREERFGDGIVEAVADRAHRSEQAGVTEPVAEQP